MKQFFSIITLIFSLSFLTSCGQNKPEDVAEKFTRAYQDMDYATAKSLSTKTGAEQLSVVEQLAEALPESTKKKAKSVVITMGETKVSGDKAIAYYTTSDYDGAQRVNLVKEDGKWKVAWDKTDAVQGTEKHKETPGTAEDPKTEASPGVHIEIGQPE